MPNPIGPGDIIINVDIGLEGLDEAEIELATIATQLEDIYQPLRASAGIAREDMIARFDSETDPDGKKWVPLDEDYLRSKLSYGYPKDILVRTTDLRKAATSPSAFVVIPEEEDGTVWFDTSGLPDYWEAHQTGSDPEGHAGSVIKNVKAESGFVHLEGTAARHRRQIAEEPSQKKEAGGSHTNLGIGRGYALPRRAFIGMSEIAEAEMYKLFDVWFEEATQAGGTGFVVGSSGALQKRGPGGRFGPRVFL